MNTIQIYPYVANTMMLFSSYLVIYYIVQSQLFRYKVEAELRGDINKSFRIYEAVKIKTKLNPGTPVGDVVRLVIAQQHTGLMALKSASPQLGMALTVIALVLFGLFGDGIDTKSLLTLFTAALTTTAIGAINALLANIYLNSAMHKLCDRLSELFLRGQLTEKKQRLDDNVSKIHIAKV
jgi:hypothetical protein